MYTRVVESAISQGSQVGRSSWTQTEISIWPVCSAERFVRGKGNCHFLTGVGATEATVYGSVPKNRGNGSIPHNLEIALGLPRIDRHIIPRYSS